MAGTAAAAAAAPATVTAAAPAAAAAAAAVALFPSLGRHLLSRAPWRLPARRAAATDDDRVEAGDDCCRR